MTEIYQAVNPAINRAEVSTAGNYGQAISREVYPLHDGGAEIEALFPEAIEEELRWQERALCAQTDPEAFFPEKGGSTREAKRICTTCPVRDECLEYALGNDERFGIWGGLSERERRRLKRRVS